MSLQRGEGDWRWARLTVYLFGGILVVGVVIVIAGAILAGGG